MPRRDRHEGAVPYPLAKRALDRTLATLLLVALSPAFAAVALAMGLDMALVPRDRGGWLYRERRVSRGRVFSLVKFRTLREDVLERMRGEGGYARQYEANLANLTWAGRRVLKPYYLDELPQLLNVVAGHMSLVGPRPWPPAAVAEQVADGLDFRTRAVAGWTGPAQVRKGGPETGPGPDLEYVEACQTWSGWRLVRYDLGLLAETARVLARGEGLRD